MIQIGKNGYYLEGPQGALPINEDDEITLKLGMLIEGECEGYGRSKAASKYGYTRQRYHQILKLFKEKGAKALTRGKTGPKHNYRRTDEVVRQIIRHRFLDPEASAEVIAQKLSQCGYPIAIRSVHRVISEYGLQKKTAQMSSEEKSRR